MLLLSFIILWIFAELSPLVGISPHPTFGKGRTLSAGFFTHFILWLFTWIALHSFTAATPPYWEYGEYWVYETDDGYFAMKMYDWDSTNSYPSYVVNITASNDNVTIPFFTYLPSVDSEQTYVGKFSRNNLGLLKLEYGNETRDFKNLKYVYIPLSHHSRWDQDISVENSSNDEIATFELDAEVKGEKEITTDAGTFLCQEIELNFSYAPGIVTIYYSKEVNNFVKITGAFGELTLVKHGEESEKKYFEDSNKNGVIDVFESLI